MPAVEGLSVLSASDGGAIVHVAVGQVLHTLPSQWNHSFRRFGPQGQAIGPDAMLLESLETIQNAQPILIGLRSDGQVRVVLNRRNESVRRWSLHTLNPGTGAWASTPAQLLEINDSSINWQEWGGMVTLSDGSVVLLAMEQRTSPGLGTLKRVLLRRLAVDGSWVSWDV